jgi:Transcription elongation factor
MHTTFDLPPITLSADDAERLWALSSAGRRSVPHVADFLEGELERANILPAGAVPPDIVRMGSRVLFRDENSGHATSAVLVYPGQENAADQHVSVLSPVGAALIGLSPGQTIAFVTPLGRTRRLTVLAVGDGA